MKKNAIKLGGVGLTKEELRQIYYINKEIKMWQNELDKLRCKCLVKSPVMNDMPRGGQISDITDCIADIADYEAVIKGLLAKAEIQRKRIMDYMESIDDSLMKQIVYLRNVCLMEWEDVATAIGGGNTENAVKKSYSRFVNKR